MKKTILFLLLLILALGTMPAAADEGGDNRIFQFEEGADGQLYGASSVLVGDGKKKIGTFQAGYLFDRKGATCWAEGRKGSGVGESVHLVIPENVKYFNMINGYIISRNAFYWNERVKRMKIGLFIGFRSPEHDQDGRKAFEAVSYKEAFTFVKDTLRVQSMPFFFNWEDVIKFRDEVTAKRNQEGLSTALVEYIVELKFTEVFEGQRDQDLCITDLWFSDTNVEVEKAQKAVVEMTKAGDGKETDEAKPEGEEDQTEGGGESTEGGD